MESIDAITDKKNYVSPQITIEKIDMEYGIAAGSVQTKQEWDTDSDDKTILW